MKNGDAIRSMSDEELADLLERCICPKDTCPDTGPYEKHCKNCVLDWLRQEVTK